jgi:Zn-dependent protease with chaperone function
MAIGGTVIEGTEGPGMVEAGDARGGRPWLVALFLVLLFPIAGFAIGIGVEAKYQADVDAEFEAEIGRPPTAEERRGFTVAAICREPEMADDPACADIALAELTRAGAIIALIVGLALLGFVAFTARRARQDRGALLRLFAPALYVVLSGVALIVVLDGLLLLSSVYLGLGVFLGRVFPIVLLGIAIAILLGVAAVLRALFAARRRAVASVLAHRVAPETEPGLSELIAQVAHAVGTTTPDHTYLGLDPEFYVTEVDVETPDGRSGGRSIYLSLPLMRILSTSELRAILGHEMGHFRGEDTAWSQRFYPIYRGAGQALDGLVRAGSSSGIRAATLFPATVILGLFMDGFATAERAISRDRELEADRIGVEVASAHDLGSSLVKLLAFTQAWSTTIDSMIADAAEGRTTANASDRFVGTVRSAASPAALDDLDEREIPHPTDGHPPVSRRLEAIGLTVADIAKAALDVAPAAAADAVIRDRTAIEAGLTEVLDGRIRAYVARTTSGAA